MLGRRLLRLQRRCPLDDADTIFVVGLALAALEQRRYQSQFAFAQDLAGQQTEIAKRPEKPHPLAQRRTHIARPGLSVDLQHSGTNSFHPHAKSPAHPVTDEVAAQMREQPKCQSLGFPGAL